VNPLPDHAEVVIVGGGVMGTSVAFHLAEAGVRDVLLLERDALGSGSTSKAAGGVRAQFSDALNIALGARGLEAFEGFAQRPGGEIDLQQVGYLFCLTTAEDLATFEAAVALQNDLGVNTRMLTAAEAQSLAPVLTVDDVLGAIEARAPALADVGIAHRWAGLYEDSPDHNALIGQAAHRPGFFYATGFSGHGFLQGPAVGEVLRDLWLGREPFVDVTPLSADRFAVGAARPERHIV
jgi:glycine/D-amino acid oxidase-like deaminating enzyme